MKGTNIVRGHDNTTRGLRLQVHETFATIQGEGPHSGKRAVFIRLTGCCLRCWWCDTEWNDEGDSFVDVEEVATIARVAGLRLFGIQRLPLVVITGGEPTNWPLGPLVEELLQRFDRVQVETAGVRWDDVFSMARVDVVVSPKTPLVNERLHRLPNCFWKYPLLADEVSPDDGLPVTNTQVRDGSKRALARPVWLAEDPSRVYVTPVDTGDPDLDMRSREVVAQSAMRFGYTAQVQVHKLLRLP